MASIVDLCWATAEDLFRDLDLDDLYMRQINVLGLTDNQRYPYLVVVYTGKISLGINLGHNLGSANRSGSLQRGRNRQHESGELFSWNPAKEPVE